MTSIHHNWQFVFSRMSHAINHIANHYTNNGGCCVVAGLVGKALELQGIEVIGGAVETSAYSVDDVRQYKARSYSKNWWMSSKHNFQHVRLVFRVDGQEWVWDTDYANPRPFRKGTIDYADGFLTPDEMLEISSTPDGWNSMFPRETIPRIARAINRYLTPKVKP